MSTTIELIKEKNTKWRKKCSGTTTKLSTRVDTLKAMYKKFDKFFAEQFTVIQQQKEEAEQQLIYFTSETDNTTN